MSFNQSIKSYEAIESCLCCKSEVVLLLDLKDQPLANNFHLEKEICEQYPLKLMYCQNCYHCQLSHTVNPEILFKHYLYVSHTSDITLRFFQDNAKFIHEYKDEVGKVLDIGCNDGSQLDCFKALGWETYGVDPAQNLHEATSNKGHTVICDFFNTINTNLLPKMDVIVAQNVFAHTKYVDDFLQNCKKLMHEDTSLFIQTSQKDMIANFEFDTVYHEHISFFNTMSMDTLTKNNGLVLNRILEHSIHGKSYIFEIKLSKDDSINNIHEHLMRETEVGLYDEALYQKFRDSVNEVVSNLKAEIDKYREEYKCIGFGASAKGQTLLCYGDIQLDYIIDENPLKIGRYSPKQNIPIVGLDHFENDESEKFLIVILAWNFREGIKEKIRERHLDREKVVIERYFPSIIYTNQEKLALGLSQTK